MAVFVETTTDAFQETLDRERDVQRGGVGHNDSKAGRRIVRRPMRGLEIKDDTNAVIKVIQANGEELPLVDAGAFNASGRTNQYSNFILQSVQEARMEKHQIVETFGESYVFFFGEAPRFVDVSSIIVNSHDFNWEAEWWENYENNFRGTKLVERGARLYLFYDDSILEGYMIQSQAMKSAQEPHLIQMNFRLFVTSYRNITFVGNPQFPIRASVAIPESIDLRAPGSRSSLVSSLLGEARGAATDRNFADAVARGIIAPREESDIPVRASSGDSLIDDIINDPGGRAGRPGQAFDPERPPDFGGSAAERASSVSSARRQLSREGQFGQKTSLSHFLRAAPLSVSLPASIATSIELLGGGGALKGVLGNRPVRQVISANADEYLGFTEVPGIGDLPPAVFPAQTQQEVDDLHLAAIAAMACYGADINNNGSILDIGLMPKFGADANDPATFQPIPGIPFGIGLTEPDKTRSQLSAIRRDPLGVIFGTGNQTNNEVITNQTKQGAGDKKYGYRSDYGRRPGVGRAGYGDNGGRGYGGGQGAGGDPGFKDPEKFSFLGVDGEAAAFSRFNRSEGGNTVFGESGARVSLGASNSGLSGGGATRIQGSPSPFSIASVRGTLKTTAGASAFASAGASAESNFNADGVFIGASASASASAGFSLGSGGNDDNCTPQAPGLTLTLGI